jgi:hypothetical protein
VTASGAAGAATESKKSRRSPRSCNGRCGLGGRKPSVEEMGSGWGSGDERRCGRRRRPVVRSRAFVPRSEQGNCGDGVDRAAALERSAGAEYLGSKRPGARVGGGSRTAARGRDRNERARRGRRRAGLGCGGGECGRRRNARDSKRKGNYRTELDVGDRP